SGGWSASSAATSRPRCPSIGASPEPTWTTCSGDSTKRSSSPMRHDDHPRTSKKEHLAAFSPAQARGLGSLLRHDILSPVGMLPGLGSPWATLISELPVHACDLLLGLG